MENVLETQNLGKRYRRGWALRDCTLELPKGRVVGLIGMNGAGKTTLMRLATGLITPDMGSVRVCGETPAPNSKAFLKKIGFVPQEHGLYLDFAVREICIMGRKLNEGWDQGLADRLIERLHISQKQKVGKLSGGQRAQLALILAIAKRPQLLILDEPLANVDPLARQEFMKVLMEMTVEQEISVIISSHILSDLEATCDYLVILSSAQVMLAQDSEQLLQEHKYVVGPEQSIAVLAEQHEVIQSSQNGRQSSLLLRVREELEERPGWQSRESTLEEIALAYMRMGSEIVINKALENKVAVRQEI